MIAQLVMRVGPPQFMPSPGSERPVNFQERLPILRFPGYQPDDRL
jgi:hypothetical protein